MVLGRTLLATLFAGLMVLAVGPHILPQEGETVLSQVARSVFGGGVAYYTVQMFTVLILFLAANTAFAGFPRLLAILARDGYVSRRFTNLNDTLVHGLGIGLLAASAALLLVLFRGNTHRLIPLYAVGVFTAFTLSQTGMVVHWLRERRLGTGRHTWSLLVNGLGAVACAGVLAIVVLTRFALDLHNGTASQVLRELLYSEGVLITVIPFYVDLLEEGTGGHVPCSVPAPS